VAVIREETVLSITDDRFWRTSGEDLALKVKAGIGDTGERARSRVSRKPVNS